MWSDLNVIEVYIVYNKKFMIVEEFVHVLFDESRSKLQDH